MKTVVVRKVMRERKITVRIYTLSTISIRICIVYGIMNWFVVVVVLLHDPYAYTGKVLTYYVNENNTSTCIIHMGHVTSPTGKLLHLM